MKNFTHVLIAAFVLSTSVALHAQDKPVCGTEIMWQRMIENDITLLKHRQKTIDAIEYVFNRTGDSRADDSTLRIIPVVVHIIHRGGTENISDEQVINALTLLNDDYQRKNADTVNTPAKFKLVAADCRIEFRLATKDPNGNCTNGINRVYSNRAYDFNDYAKSVSYWPSDKYFNIWVVDRIEQVGNPFGTLIGYAHFPGGPPETDGLVINNKFFGTTGSASGNAFYKGRNATHETAHYLNLLDLSYCGGSDDGCADTPPSDFANCPAYPHVICNNDTAMPDNFLALSDGSCSNMFTLCQKQRMRATLDTARFMLWQSANLVSTGTADPYIYPPHCAPKADALFGPGNINVTFPKVVVCEGGGASSKVSFKDNSTAGTVTSWSWLMPGASPSSSNLQNPTVYYTSPGVYEVTLTVSNSNGSSTITIPDAVTVEGTNGVFSPVWTESFETAGFPYYDWRVYNFDGGATWARTNRAAYTGSNSLSVQNFETVNNTAPNSLKEFHTQSFNCATLQSSPTPMFKFRLSYGQQYAGNDDSLKIYMSTSCAGTFNLIKGMVSSEMSSLSAGFQPNDFAPTQLSQWTQVAIPISNAVGKTNVRFKFTFISGVLSNNIYIDDINIDGTVGLKEETEAAFAFSVQPNPTAGIFELSYVLSHPEEVTINLYDLQGRLVKALAQGDETPGIHRVKFDAASLHLAEGLYMLRLISPSGAAYQKLVYSD